MAERNDAVSADELAARDLDAPLEDPTVSLLRSQPVLLLGLVLLLPSAGAAVAAWADGQTAVAIVTSALSVLIATLTPIVRRAVTPVARPMLDRETPLVVPTFEERERLGL